MQFIIMGAPSIVSQLPCLDSCRLALLPGSFATETFIHREDVALFEKVSRNRAPTRNERHS
jgi:hypothetical protein